MEKTLKKGDAVRWETSHGKTMGKVVARQTSPMQIKGHKVEASPEQPQYIVQSDKTGAKAVHKAGALKKG